MHAQIFGKNFMVHCFWNTHFFSYLSNCQMTIWTDDFTKFCNIIVSFRRWWPSRTRIIINRSSALFETLPPLVRLSPAHMASSLNAIFKISNVSVTDFPIFTKVRCSGKTLIFLSRENHQMHQTSEYIKKHSRVTKQDRAMRFSRHSSSNSLLESSTCRAPLGRRNGGLFWTFGNFPDSPYICLFAYLFMHVPIYLCIYILNYLFIFIGITSTLIWKCDKPHTPRMNTVQ